MKFLCLCALDCTTVPALTANLSSVKSNVSPFPAEVTSLVRLWGFIDAVCFPRSAWTAVIYVSLWRYILRQQCIILCKMCSWISGFAKKECVTICLGVGSHFIWTLDKPSGLDLACSTRFLFYRHFLNIFTEKGLTFQLLRPSSETDSLDSRENPFFFITKWLSKLKNIFNNKLDTGKIVYQNDK